MQWEDLPHISIGISKLFSPSSCIFSAFIKTVRFVIFWRIARLYSTVWFNPLRVRPVGWISQLDWEASYECSEPSQIYTRGVLSRDESWFLKKLYFKFSTNQFNVMNNMNWSLLADRLIYNFYSSSKTWTDLITCYTHQHFNTGNFFLI